MFVSFHTLHRFFRGSAAFFGALAIAAVPPLLGAEAASELVDDFSDAALAASGAARIVVDDASLGGSSSAALDVRDGVLVVSGEHRPARGAPGFVSLVLLLALDGAARDASDFEGVRLRLKPLRGTTFVHAVSAAIDNYDHHGAPVSAKAGDFREVRIRFSDMRRSWSEQTKLDLTALTAISIVAVGMAPGTFAYEVDEVEFYRADTAR
jgi:hypothetical protein